MWETGESPWLCSLKSTSNPLGDVSDFYVFLHCVRFLNPLPNLKPQFSSSFSPTFSLYSNFNCRCFHISLCITLLPSTLLFSSLFYHSLLAIYVTQSMRLAHTFLYSFLPFSSLFSFQKPSKIEQM